MTDPIGPGSPAGAAGFPNEPVAKDPSPDDQRWIDTLKMQIAMMKASGPNAPPQVLKTLEDLLQAVQSGFTTIAEAKVAFAKLEGESTDQMTDTMIGIISNEAVKATHNPFLEEIKKEMEDDQ